VKIEEGQQKIKIVRTNRQSNLLADCQSIFSLCRHPRIKRNMNAKIILVFSHFSDKMHGGFFQDARGILWMPDTCRQFAQDIGEWPENQILIPDWTYFHCPDATLAHSEGVNSEGTIKEGSSCGRSWRRVLTPP